MTEITNLIYIKNTEMRLSLFQNVMRKRFTSNIPTTFSRKKSERLKEYQTTKFKIKGTMKKEEIHSQKNETCERST